MSSEVVVAIILASCFSMHLCYLSGKVAGFLSSEGSRRALDLSGHYPRNRSSVRFRA